MISAVEDKTESRNPYVGPQPFRTEDQAFFFGRDREVNEAVSLVIAHRVLVLYAESGAGKTSLINAGILPRLAKEEFQVLPPARVRGMIPQDIRNEDIANLYVFNSLLGWTTDDDPRGLTQVSLVEFLGEVEHPTTVDELPSARVIIFDQFEELFTSYLERWKDREDFFRQMREVLDDDPLLRVVLVIREDYIAQLDAYAPLLPERLQTRFRLERMRKPAALAAVTGPLTHTSRKYAKGVAETLVDDLQKVQVQVTADKTVEVEGEFIEPVQLQVVCQSLWSELPPDVAVIEQAHLRTFGDVNRALSRFYEDAIKEAGKDSHLKEGRLREWFERFLITPAGTRGTVFRGSEETGGIKNSAVDALEHQHILRAEVRAGSRWYELTHDRFIEPIKSSNAVYWLQQMRMRRRIISGLAISLGIALIPVVLAGWQQMAEAQREAETQRHVALSRQLAAQTTSLISQGLLERVLLLSQEALRISETMEARSALLTALLYDPRLNAFLRGHGGSVLNNVAFSPDGKMLASGSGDGTIILWDLQTRPGRVPGRIEEPFIGEPLKGHNGLVSSVAFSPDSRMLASGSGDGTVILWDLQTRPGKVPEWLGEPLKGHDGGISSVAFSADSRMLASGSGDGTIILWDIQRRQPIGDDRVSNVVFSPDGRIMASVSGDGAVTLWGVDIESWKEHACRTANRSLTLLEWEQYLAHEPYRKTCPNVLEKPTPIPTPTVVPPVPGPTPHLEHFVRDFLTRANNAEIDAYSNSDPTYAEEFFRGKALRRIEKSIADLIAKGTIFQSQLISARVINIRPISSSEIKVDTCETWARNYYDRLDESHIVSAPPDLLPQTYTIEELEGGWFITQIQFYPSHHFC
jgi:WD40 repeat protein